MPGAGIHDHDRAAVRLRLANLLRDHLLGDVLDIPVDRQPDIHARSRIDPRLLAGGNGIPTRAALVGRGALDPRELLVEGVLDTLEPSPLSTDEAHHIRGEVIGGIDPPRRWGSDDAGNAEFLDPTPRFRGDALFHDDESTFAGQSRREILGIHAEDRCELSTGRPRVHDDRLIGSHITRLDGRRENRSIGIHDGAPQRG